MGFMGGGGMAGGWSSSLTSSGPSFRRGMDGWNDEELGKLYDAKVVSRLGAYLGPYRWRLTLSIIGVVGFAFTSYMQPLLIGLAIDAIRKQDTSRLDTIGAISLVFCVASWGFQYLQLNQSGIIGHNILRT